MLIISGGEQDKMKGNRISLQAGNYNCILAFYLERYKE